MPLDVQLFRADQGGNPELIKDSQKKRFKDPKIVDEVIAFDTKARKSVGDLDNLKKQARLLSIKIGNINKQAVMY